MSSGSRARRPRGYGSPTKASNPIVAADRIVVLGAGSVGCFVGGAWQAAGLPVTFIGRPKIDADVEKDGLTLSDYEGWTAELTDVDYRTEANALADTEIIALTVKSGATADA